MFSRILTLYLVLFSCCFAQDPLKESHQLMTVITKDWDSIVGEMQRYERNVAGIWNEVGEKIPVVVGMNGMAWGIGLHPSDTSDFAHLKREGDGKSPAGIFTLGDVFGFAPKDEMGHLKMNYRCLQNDTEAVDDVNSIYYNQIVERNQVERPDWTSSEKMREISLYEIGLQINHNYPVIVSCAGSAIFMHLWRGPASGTGGCTAMENDHLESVIRWLDKNQKPLIVQLPEQKYAQLKQQWQLP